MTGTNVEEEHVEEAEGEEIGTRTPTEITPPLSPHTTPTKDHNHLTNGNIENGNIENANGKYDDTSDEATQANSKSVFKSSRHSLIQQSGIQQAQEDADENSSTRLEAYNEERESLREEVAQVRKSLQDLQVRHEAEISDLREQLAGTNEGKRTAETQYQNLLGRVNTIRTQLGDRLKADAVGRTAKDCSHTTYSL